MKKIQKGLLTCGLVTILAISGFGALPAIQADTGDIPIDAAHFPDATFREWLKQGTTAGVDGSGDIFQNIDTNQDGVLSQTERDETVTMMGLTAKESVAGIENFTHLKKIDCNPNITGQYDFSHVLSLENLKVPADAKAITVGALPNLHTLNVVNYAGTPVDISQLANLERYVGWYSQSYAGQLRKIDFSGNPKLKEISLMNARVQEVNVQNNPELVEFTAPINDLKTLDLSNNKKLQLINLSDNPELTDFKTGTLPELKIMNILDLALFNLDMSNYPKIEELYAARIGATALDFSNNPALKYLELRGNHLTTLDLSNQTKLETLIAQNNQLTQVMLPRTNTLTEVGLNDNQLTGLNLGDAPKLVTLGLNRNKLSAITLSANPNLVSLGVANNELITLNLSNNPLLVHLLADNNHLT
ncbi:MAG: hypothetical protein LBT80_07830, partial [Lactobacillaceae bacterium]|nr:hypothetical protein [Lactobacillaceae bacterium]